MTGFSFTVHATDGTARAGTIRTAHGEVATPAFMAVGTAATVKAMQMRDVRETGTDVVLGNTYHLMLRPTAERVAEMGGLHKFMNWPHTILTDSGGFQVMSLAKLRKVTEEGVAFQSHIDGSKHMLTPERSMEIQSVLGSDIHMQFDECVELPNTREEIDRAMRLSLRWAERSKSAFRGGPGQAPFAIVQGGDQIDLRQASARELVAMDFPGYAVGGLAVGEPQEVMLRVLDETVPVLPAAKPRYLMGVGTPDDLLQSLSRGIDMFDCVMPTRAGRHGQAYTRFGRLNLKNARHATDPAPLDPESRCPAARDYSRAYLHHLVRSEEILGMTLLTWANLAYYQDLMAGARAAIGAGKLGDYIAETKAGWARGEEA
ncbi:queuine tRNA-ribosyltransferase [Terrihabitans soli]|uniref:Queuine tRNA-ribosyltransferase n=1 Tax=Terrihabitans soli TaxID=708113 RepID=A0A6S6QWL4_9HYPH|nr:tRNA guanosine(34) transglycosylase Tgt [Terrihabitans soli]BCJ90918.1 queuine tRNA-ribosyltransferase [Terrihabitans soli]